VWTSFDWSNVFLNRRKRASNHGPLPNDPRQNVGDPETADLVDLGLSHLNEVQRVGLRDDVLAGFYCNDTHEVFPGVHLGPEDLLIDVGCGSGGVLEFCQRYAGKIFALDIDAAALSAVRSRTQFTNSENISFVSASAEQLPITTGTATKVLCLEVLEHVDDPELVVAELFRVGRPGCIYLISVPGQFSESMMQKVAPREMFEKPHHIRIFSQTEFSSLVERSGLTILTESGSGAFSTLFVAMYWQKFGTQPGQSFEAVNPELSHHDPLLQDWAKAWNHLLDLPNGEDIKAMFDTLIPKSQIIVAVKPDLSAV
jgi:ubiquinone/menaquinone biosynthesis C-methylase UbiE